MVLSQTAEYALRAVLWLAEHGHGDTVRVDEIARALGIPANYLSKTLHTLVRARVLRSTRGPRGGFRLAVPPERLSLIRVVAPFEELDARRRCLLGRPECSDRNPCPVHDSWKQTAERVAQFFRATTVADVCRSATAASSRAPSSRRKA